QFAKGQAAPRPSDGASGGLTTNRGAETERQLNKALDELNREKDPARRAQLAAEAKKLKDDKETYDRGNSALRAGDKNGFQAGKLGVDLSIQSNNLRCQERLSLTANRQANGRQVLELGGVWIDEAFKPDTATVVVKSQSDAYFKILEKYPAMKDVYRLGNHVVWVAPSGTALGLRQNDGKEQPTDAEL